jgi:DNA binding domain, excisionase family
MSDMAYETSKGGYEVAVQETGLKLGTIYSMVSQKKIPHTRLGKRLVVFDRNELRAWMAANAVPPAPAVILQYDDAGSAA